MGEYLETAVVPVVREAPRVVPRRSTGEMTFDARIPAELAAQLRPPQEVLADYGFTGQNAFNLVVHPLFQVELKRYLEENEQGLTFRRRAQLMAPDMLEHAYEIATDKEVGAATRLEAARFITRMADVEPKEKSGGPNSAFQLIINV